MSADRVLLASDVHLGVVAPEIERAFVRWLEFAGSTADLIVINGDLFDFWFEYRTAIPSGHTRVLGTLQRIVDGGVPVWFVGGNHDWWGGRFLSDEIGMEVIHEAVIRDLAGHRTLLAHGDGLGRGDLGYRILKSVLRGRLPRWGFRWLHPDIGALIAQRVSHTGPMDTQTPEVRSARSAALESWATSSLKADRSLDLVVLGHTHDPRCVEITDGRWYVNSGDWVDHRTYLTLEVGSDPVLSEWAE